MRASNARGARDVMPCMRSSTPRACSVSRGRASARCTRVVTFSRACVSSSAPNSAGAVVAPAVVITAGLLAYEHVQARKRLENDSIATARAMVYAIDRELVAVTAMAEVLATSNRARAGDGPTCRARSGF